MEIKIKRTIAVLLAVCFLVSVTAVAVSADQADYDRGYQQGVKDGTKDGINDCKNGQISKGTTGTKGTKGSPTGPSDETRGWTDGYKVGYTNGARSAGCLKPPSDDVSGVPGLPNGLVGAELEGVGPVNSEETVCRFSFQNGNDYNVEFKDWSYAAGYGKIIEWNWSFGDGDTSTRQNPNHKYSDQGPYTAKLTIKTEKGEEASYSQEINPVEDIGIYGCVKKPLCYIIPGSRCC